jgi:hypothetical protein
MQKNTKQWVLNCEAELIINGQNRYYIYYANLFEAKYSNQVLATKQAIIQVMASLSAYYLKRLCKIAKTLLSDYTVLSSLLVMLGVKELLQKLFSVML